MTKLTALSLLLLGSFFLVSPAHAQETQTCDQATLDAVGKLLGVKNFRVYKYGDAAAVVIAAACKPWPKNKRIMLVSAAYALPDYSLKNQNRGLVVAMLDTSSQRIISSYKGKIGQRDDQEGGMGPIDGLRLDTARYNLAPNIRAFGVVIEAGAYNIGVGWENRWILFIKQDRKLRPILRANLDQSLGRYRDSACSYNDTSSHFIIAVEKKHSHGLADLAMIEQYKTDEDKADGETMTVAHYDGKEYDWIEPVADFCDEQ